MPTPAPLDPTQLTLGVVGTGALGGAIARRLLRSGALRPEQLHLANRSGRRSGFEPWPDVALTTDMTDLAARADVLLFALPPAATFDLRTPAAGALILSVMAGVTLRRLEEITGASRIVRAMSSPAAETGLAYSPWTASSAATGEDRAVATALFGACGLTDEVESEDQIDHFTALTGPVPGFVAYFAECMAAYASDHGVPPDIADRAVRQLFRASGEILAQETSSAAAHVEEMIRYAGTTAAGLETMRAGPLRAAIAEGLEAAYEKARRIAEPPTRRD